MNGAGIRINVGTKTWNHWSATSYWTNRKNNILKLSIWHLISTSWTAIDECWMFLTLWTQHSAGATICIFNFGLNPDKIYRLLFLHECYTFILCSRVLPSIFLQLSRLKCEQKPYQPGRGCLQCSLYWIQVIMFLTLSFLRETAMTFLYFDKICVKFKQFYGFLHFSATFLVSMDIIL